MMAADKENTLKDIGLIYKNARKAFRAQKQSHTAANTAPTKHPWATEAKKKTI